MNLMTLTSVTLPSKYLQHFPYLKIASNKFASLLGLQPLDYNTYKSFKDTTHHLQFLNMPSQQYLLFATIVRSIGATIDFLKLSHMHCILFVFCYFSPLLSYTNVYLSITQKIMRKKAKIKV
jgi:hypothetical protein